MTNHQLVILFAIFCFKHFLVDFLLQNKWQYSNKHIFGHPGGIFHAWLHGLNTIVILILFVTPIPSFLTVITIGLIEWIIHYVVDWGKMNINIFTEWKCNTHEEFWYLTGFDQFLHYCTYIGIIYYLI